MTSRAEYPAGETPAEPTAEDIRRRALRLLEKRDYSTDEMDKKLREKGASPQASAACIAQLVSVGFLDDRRYAAQVVRHYAAAGMGQRRIRTELQRRGVDRDLWDEALASVPEDTQPLDRLLEQKLRGCAPEGRELKRATDYLARRGFGWGEISEAVERYKIRKESEE